ncbi:hypothetical protein DOY81_002530, partial [Sarcophaga bullata]
VRIYIFSIFTRLKQMQISCSLFILQATTNCRYKRVKEIKESSYIFMFVYIPQALQSTMPPEKYEIKAQTPLYTMKPAKKHA